MHSCGKDWRGGNVLEVGKFAFDTENSANVQILEKIEAWGYISYRVFNPASGHVYKLSEEQLMEDGGTNTYDLFHY